MTEMTENTENTDMKRKVGRPRVTDIYATGKEYFRQYYHANNRDILRECGCEVKKGSMKMHLATRRHFVDLRLKEYEKLQTIVKV